MFGLKTVTDPSRAGGSEKTIINLIYYYASRPTLTGCSPLFFHKHITIKKWKLLLVGTYRDIRGVRMPVLSGSKATMVLARKGVS